MSDDIVRFILMFVIVPLWGTAGLADWLCHRRAHIAENSGPGEWLIHLLMLAEVSIPVLAGMFLEIDALLIGGMIAFFIIHRISMMWDVHYAVKHREVTRTERRVHNVMELLPFLALLSIVDLHWAQFLALLGLGPGTARYDLAWKQDKLPTAYIAVVLFNLTTMELLPYLYELYSGFKPANLRRQKQRRVRLETER